MLAKETLPPSAPPHWFMIATNNSFEPHSSDALPDSKKVFVPGTLYPGIRVPQREITLRPTQAPNGRSEPNKAVRVYDCSGPWGDENFAGSVRDGLPALRRDWILERGDVEEADGQPVAAEGAGPHSNGIASDSKLDALDMPRRRPLRAKAGKVVTQLQYARQGVITPEMEFIAIREDGGGEGAAGGDFRGNTRGRRLALPFRRGSRRSLCGRKWRAGGPSFRATSIIPNWSR